MDRTTRGFLAGIIAGAVMNAWNLIDYYFLHITEIRFLDWFSILTSWAKPENIFEAIIALIFQTVLWDGFLGVVFAHLIFLITSKGVVYKSVVYSLLCWFFFKVMVNFYHVPLLSGKQSLSGRLSNIMAAILWGIIMGLTLRKLDKSVL